MKLQASDGDIIAGFSSLIIDSDTFTTLIMAPDYNSLFATGSLNSNGDSTIMKWNPTTVLSYEYATFSGCINMRALTAISNSEVFFIYQGAGTLNIYMLLFNFATSSGKFNTKLIL